MQCNVDPFKKFLKKPLKLYLFQTMCYINSSLLKGIGIEQLINDAGLSILNAGTALLSVVNVCRSRYLIEVQQISPESHL